MSLIRNTLALSALSALAAAQTSTTPRLNAACADVVIFMARGNDAPYHDTRTSPFIDATCAKVKAEGKTCDYEDIQFDVTLGAPWCPQISEGAMNGIKQITDFNARCPCSHIVVNGYSEGANVVGDVLGGPSGCDFPSTGLDSESKAGKAIAAALIWGDVRHTANQPYNVLDGSDKGPYPRPADSLERLNRYSSVLRSYCAAGDPICAGGKNVTQHLNYFEIYTDAASSWAVGKVDAAAPLCAASTSSSAAPTATATTPASSGSPSTATATTPASSGSPSSGSPSSASVVTPASSAPVSYPTATSPASVAPFPPAKPYPTDSCVVVYEIKYVYGA